MKNNMILLTLLVSSLSLGNVEVLQVADEAVVAPMDLGPVSVLHHKGFFGVTHENKLYDVHNYNVDKTVRNMNESEVKEFLNSGGYFKLNRNAAHQFTLEAMQRVHGGGVICGRIGYWLTKSLCWSVVGCAGMGAAATIAPAIPGVVLPAATGAGLKVGAGAIIAKAGGGVKAAGFFANIMYSLGFGKAAATGVGAGLSATGTGTGLVAGIETASLSVSAGLTLIPWLP